MSLAAVAVLGGPLLLGTGAGTHLAQGAVAVVALATAASLWRAGDPGTGRRLRGWRLVSLAVLTGVAGGVVDTAVHAAGAQPAADLLRTSLSLPGHLLALAGLLTLMSRGQLRAGGPRLAAEVALFLAGVVALGQVLVVGPATGDAPVGPSARVALEITVVTGALALSAALTLLARSIGSRRCTAALVLVALTTLAGADALWVVAGSRQDAPAALVVVGGLLDLAGLLLLTVSARRHPGRRLRLDGDRLGERVAQAGQLVPYVVLVLASGAVLATATWGPQPPPTALLAVLCCVALTVAHRWVTARDADRVDAQLRRSEAHFRSLVRSQTDAVLILDDGAQLLWVAPSLVDLLGPDAPVAVGRTLPDAVPADDRPALVQWLGAVGEPGPATLHMLRLTGADGRRHHLEATATDLRQDPGVQAVVLYCRDVTARVEREAELTRLAVVDAVTGLPNRAALTDAMAAESAHAVPLAHAPSSAVRPSAALLLLEVAGLGDAKDVLGRRAVEDALAEVGCRLRAVLREGDLVARFSGEVFGVLAHGEVGEADLVAARCLSVIEQPITSQLGLLDLTASVGMAVVVPGVGVPEVVERAELALSAAWTAGQGVVRSWSAGLQEARDRTEQLRRDLVGARARGELGLVYQPIVSLAERRVTGAEALVRWTHPVLGDVPPQEFLPIAERAGLMPDIERWVLVEAATAAAALPAHGTPLRMGVDVSAAHIAAGTLVDHVSAALSSSGLSPERLVVEVNDSWMTADGERLRAEFSALRLLGVQVALDGFGAETSSLGHLTRLPLDIVKLDRTFLSRIDRDSTTRALCESAIGIARRLGFDVVADGVESPSELAVLTRLGCGYGQGYLLARPMSLTSLVEVLDERAGQLWPGLVGQS